MTSLTDSFGRHIKYLRLSVTDRCNLRCFYCMPHEGIDFLPKEQLLTYEELWRLTALLADMGIEKVRITGGEPFIRKDLIHFLEKLKKIDGINRISITTNGILTAPFIPDLVRLGIKQINLSLDTLSEMTFQKITRRNDFQKVMETFHILLHEGFEVKVNVVVMEGINDHEIADLASLAMKYPVSVRFIEEMPFNGSGRINSPLRWNHAKIRETLEQNFAGFEPLLNQVNTTSENFSFDGAKGSVGIIAAYTRNFCGTCDRLRITSTGALRTCLYSADGLDLKGLLRNGATDEELRSYIAAAIKSKPRDGFEAEKLREFTNPANESMAGIGG